MASCETSCGVMSFSHKTAMSCIDTREIPGTLHGDDAMVIAKRSKFRTRRSSAYKHVPHSEKPPQLVARRNARERRRVQAVNNAFACLRRHVPYENRHKRLSKVKTLRHAIDYIRKMKKLINDHDARQETIAAMSRLQQPDNGNAGYVQEQQYINMVDLSSCKENHTNWNVVSRVSQPELSSCLYATFSPLPPNFRSQT
ncbi:achaete-scute complex protein T5-like isoform X1 [Lingula anatina]|uniref:Achaete-scute complex protein T5-like isoform X1 n=1 Tax=Lingula anatina TaxID=7574 RepID=A0A1S3HJM1_LINAN|nr:achaete-scute complex protein T5-like isoform X1 [Lingula anatina]|eukprot:XP_013385189.1 achaete-scute complex protein T5-like isoform X1 [Lingula anatina]